MAYTDCGNTNWQTRASSQAERATRQIKSEQQGTPRASRRLARGGEEEVRKHVSEQQGTAAANKKRRSSEPGSWPAASNKQTTNNEQRGTSNEQRAQRAGGWQDQALRHAVADCPPGAIRLSDRKSGSLSGCLEVSKAQLSVMLILSAQQSPRRDGGCQKLGGLQGGERSSPGRASGACTVRQETISWPPGGSSAISDRHSKLVRCR
jgi:hypothetical protein